MECQVSVRGSGLGIVVKVNFVVALQVSNEVQLRHCPVRLYRQE